MIRPRTAGGTAASGDSSTDPFNSAFFAMQGNSLVATVVPEPGSCVLVTAGALGLTISRRRRRVSQSN